MVETKTQHLVNVVLDGWRHPILPRTKEKI
jgi:hypothetical protein